MVTLAAGLLVMVIEFSVIPEKRAEFVAMTAERVPQVRAFDGNVQFEVLVDEARPNVVLYLERWKSQEQQSAFLAWWQAQGMYDRMRPLVTAPPKVTAYRQAVD